MPPPFLTTVRDDVLRYIDERKLDRPVIVGHSLGGFLAFSIAAAAPGKVGPLLAVDGVPFLPALMDPKATPDASRPGAEQIRKLYASFSPEQLAAQSARAFAGMIADPKQVEAATAWSAASDPATAGAAVYELMTTDLRDAVAAIQSPVLLLGAAGFAQDDATRKAVAAAYEAQVAKVPHHRVELAATKHFIMLDDPAFFFSKLDGFLGAEVREEKGERRGVRIYHGVHGPDPGPGAPRAGGGGGRPRGLRPPGRLDARSGLLHRPRHPARRGGEPRRGPGGLPRRLARPAASCATRRASSPGCGR